MSSKIGLAVDVVAAVVVVVEHECAGRESVVVLVLIYHRRPAAVAFVFVTPVAVVPAGDYFVLR